MTVGSIPNTLIVLGNNPTGEGWARNSRTATPRGSRTRRERRHATDDRHNCLPVRLEVQYTLHLGTLQDLTLIRYDNAHEGTKGHELHTAAGDADVEFPGMEELVVEFWASADEY